MSFIAGDDLVTGGLIGHHAGMIVLRVELLGEGGRAHQVNELHRQLPPLGCGDCRTRSRSLWSLGLVPLGSLSRGPSLLLANHRRRGEWAATLAAEGKVGRVRKPTLGTGRRERNPTFPTK